MAKSPEIGNPDPDEQSVIQHHHSHKTGKKKEIDPKKRRKAFYDIADLEYEENQGIHSSDRRRKKKQLSGKSEDPGRDSIEKRFQNRIPT